MITFWTPENVAELRRLIVDEQMTCMEAGIVLGTSKGAVSSKCHRLGLRLKRSPRFVRSMRRGTSREEPPTKAAKHMSLLELQRDSCRWPHGGPYAPDFGFCGEKAVRGPYCADHYAQAHY